MAIADLSDLVNKLTGGNNGNPQHLWQWVDGRIGASAATSTIVGRLASLWQYNKSPGANGAAPGAVAAPTRSTLGALGQANPSGGRKLYLLGVESAINQIGTLIVYDRLLHISGLSGTSTSAQTVGGTLGRYTSSTDSIGNQIWVEIYTQIGATGTTITASYTNENGTSGRTTKAAVIGGTNFREATRLIPLPLQDGDQGVTAVASVTLAASTGTAGDFGVNIVKPLLMAGSPGSNIPILRDTLAGLPSLPEVLTDACLAMALLAGVTTPIQEMIGTHLVEA